MKKFGKTIKLFLIDGEPNGRMSCELSNWTGKAFKIPRKQIKMMDTQLKSYECKYRKLKWYFFISVFFFACESRIVLEAPPESYQNIYYQVSEYIINGDEKSTTMEIKEERVLFYIDTAQVSYREYYIVRVEEYKNKLKIYCSIDPNDEYADHALVFESINTPLLHMTEEIQIGTDEIGSIYFGKFTKNKYLREDYYKVGNRDSY